VFGAPIIHGIHGRTGTMFGSLGLRLGVMLLTIAAAGASDGDANPGLGVLLVGGIVVSLVDSIALASGDDRPPPTTKAWRPSAVRSRDGFAFGVMRSF
jgi:hypothetical protein